MERLGHWSVEAESLKPFRRQLTRLHKISEAERARVTEALKHSKALATVVTMRDELAALWARSSDSREQLLKQLQDWCHKAESSGVAPLVEFSHRLRRYA
jgi:stearoyl-CoA desaturase (delta-9 desaturase)